MMHVPYFGNLGSDSKPVGEVLSATSSYACRVIEQYRAGDLVLSVARDQLIDYYHRLLKSIPEVPASDLSGLFLKLLDVPVGLLQDEFLSKRFFSTTRLGRELIAQRDEFLKAFK